MGSDQDDFWASGSSVSSARERSGKMTCGPQVLSLAELAKRRKPGLVLFVLEFKLTALPLLESADQGGLSLSLELSRDIFKSFSVGVSLQDNLEQVIPA